MTFVDGRTSPQFAEIKVADVVVAGEGTLPEAGDRAGMPTVMYSQVTAALGVPGEVLQPMRRMHLYEDYIRFPFDAADGPLEEIIRDSRSQRGADRRLEAPFHRRALRPARVRVAVRAASSSTGTRPMELDPTRSFTTLAFADEMLERPELLRAYAESFTPGDDASLVLWAPGSTLRACCRWPRPRSSVPAWTWTAFRTSCSSPLPGSPEADLRLGERADAVLSDVADGRPHRRAGALRRRRVRRAARRRRGARARRLSIRSPRARGTSAPGLPGGFRVPSRSRRAPAAAARPPAAGSPTAPGTEPSACLRSQSSRVSEISSPRRSERPSDPRPRLEAISLLLMLGHREAGYPSSSSATSSSDSARSESLSRR